LEPDAASGSKQATPDSSVARTYHSENTLTGEDTTHSMKPCSYCGRENQDEAISCRECGTELVAPTSTAKPAEPDPIGWLRHALRCFGLSIAIACFYLLSLGPVTRYFGTTTRAPAVTTPTSTGATIVTTVTRSYPGWVVLIYYPAFALERSDALGDVYAAYLNWWETR
jgi:hypothetical protein